MQKRVDPNGKLQPSADGELAPPADSSPSTPPDSRRREIGGPPGPEPTRFGDWEKKGRCIDF